MEDAAESGVGAEFEGTTRLPTHPWADGQQADHDTTAHDNDEHYSDEPVAAFASWLTSLYEESLSPAIEMGSLRYFRSVGYQALFNYLNDNHNADYSSAEEMAFQTLGANMFLPRKSIWTLGPADDEATDSSLPHPTSHIEPEHKKNLVVIRGGSSRLRKGTALPEILELWEMMAANLKNHNANDPGLISGNTQQNEVHRYQQIDYDGETISASLPQRALTLMFVVYLVLVGRGLPAVRENRARQVSPGRSVLPWMFMAVGGM